MSKYDGGPIPKSVLALLAERWKTDYTTSFESVFYSYPVRRVDPSFYFFREESPDQDVNGLTQSEVEKLVSDGVFGGEAIPNSGFIAVNEHAQHALLDFCQEVYSGWDKYQRRLALAARDRITSFPKGACQ